MVEAEENEMGDYRITPVQAKAAREAFEANEPRDLFYRVASELVALVLNGSTSLTLTEALAVLLQTWNRTYYQYRKFDARHFADIEQLLEKHQAILGKFRETRIAELTMNEQTVISTIFEEFERVLGPVGSAKTLHLLAPRLFPLWDRSIADAYDLPLGEAGSNGQRYWKFMLISRSQCRELDNQREIEANPLKAIDEYNYCRHTKGWLS